MTRGFYDQLGVDSDATTAEIRQAYHRLVTQFNRRRQALLERGGDPERLELARHQADEAFAVLSDPERRRRYDALLALSEEGLPRDEESLWEAVEGAMVPESLTAALELLQLTTELAVEPFPPPPGLAPPAEPEPQPIGGSVVPLPGSTATTESSGPSLRVVEGNPSGAPVIVLPTAPKPSIAVPEPPPPSGPAAFLATMGPTGAMLAAVREHLGMTLDDVAEQTRIAIRFLRAIEEEAFDRLPSATFVRGYVREMAAVLDLDEDDVVEGYMERFHGSR